MRPMGFVRAARASQADGDFSATGRRALNLLEAHGRAVRQVGLGGAE